MSHVKLFLIAVLLLLPGCIIETTSGSDREITCGNFDDFLNDCTSGCKPTWDCELNYDSLDISTQIALDDCSDCLIDNLNAGVCSDCSVAGENSCQAFMEDLLGVNCW